jgi:hypothetical protein
MAKRLNFAKSNRRKHPYVGRSVTDRALAERPAEIRVYGDKKAGYVAIGAVVNKAIFAEYNSIISKFSCVDAAIKYAQILRNHYAKITGKDLIIT